MDFLAGVLIGFCASIPSWVVVIANSWWWQSKVSELGEACADLIAERDFLRDQMSEPDSEDTDEFRGG